MKSSHISTTSRRAILPLAASIAVLLTAQHAHAATYFWNTNATGLWSAGANWSDDPISGGITGIVPTSLDLAVFNQSSVNGAEIIQLDAGTGIAGITFNNTGTTTIKSDSATPRVLTIGTSGIFINSGAGAVTIGDSTDAATITLGGAQTWSNNSSSTFTVINGVTTGANLLTINGPGNTVVTGTIGGTVGLSKAGIGNLTLQASNTYTGTTTLNGGGGLTLDYTAGSGDASKLADTSILSLIRGTVTLKGGSHTEVVASTGIGAGGSVVLNRDGGTSKLQMNTITRGAGGNITFADDTIATTDSNNVNGILGGWAIIKNGSGYDWAKSVDTGAADTAITAYTGQTLLSGTVAASTSPTTNYSMNGSVTIGAGVALRVNSLKLTDSGSSQSLALNAGGLQITAVSTAWGGIMYDGGTTGSYTIGGAGRIITTNGVTPFTNNNLDIIFAVTSGTLTVNAFVGASTSTASVAKYGAGTLVLTNDNNFTGAIRIGQGALRLSGHADAGGNASASGYTVQSGAALELSGGLTFATKPFTGWGTGVSNGGALRNISGNNTFGGAIGTAGGGHTRINSDSDILTLTGGITTAAFNDFTFGGAGNITVSTTAITGAGRVIKDGAGTLTLSASNSYTGATVIDGGTLFLSGSISGSSAVSVNTGGTLGGTGTVGALTVNGGTLAPGASPGILNAGNTTFSGGTAAFEINGTTAGTNYDQLAVTGTVIFTANTALTIDLGVFNPADDVDTFTLISNDSTDTITLNGFGFAIGANQLAEGELFTVSGQDFTISYAAGTGSNDVVLSAVPEPGSALMLVGGLATLLGFRRRRA